MKSLFARKKRECPLALGGITEIDYKDVELLKQFISEKGKILPRRITGACSKHQKMLKKVIKRARYMALLPFIVQD